MFYVRPCLFLQLERRVPHLVDEIVHWFHSRTVGQSSKDPVTLAFNACQSWQQAAVFLRSVHFPSVLVCIVY